MPKDTVVALAFGLDGEIVYTLTSYVSFYELIKNSASIVCKTNSCDVVDFLDESGSIVETLIVDDMFGSILASSPKVFVLLKRSADNLSVEDHGERPWYRNVTPGWKYDESGILPL